MEKDDEATTLICPVVVLNFEMIALAYDILMCFLIIFLMYLLYYECAKIKRKHRPPTEQYRGIVTVASEPWNEQDAQIMQQIQRYKNRKQHGRINGV
jgi:hypothetical protein